MKRPKYTPPNRALHRDDFQMPSDWEHWTLSLEMWYGFQTLKHEVRFYGGIGGALLLVMIGSLMAKVYGLL